jgi:hypothetical protein
VTGAVAVSGFYCIATITLVPGYYLISTGVPVQVLVVIALLGLVLSELLQVRTELAQLIQLLTRKGFFSKVFFSVLR